MLMGRYAWVKLLERNSVYSPFFSLKFFIKIHVKFTIRDPTIHDSVMGDQCMSWKDWHGGKQPSSHQKVKKFNCITRIRFHSFPWNHKADKTRHNFFSSDTNIFFHHSHLVCLENWFTPSTIKLNIVSGKIFTNIICDALVIPKNACMTPNIICLFSYILFRKQPLTSFLRNSCFWKLCPIRRKTHALELSF